MKVIVSRVDHHLIHIEPSCLDVLKDTLTYERRVQTGGRQQDVEYVTFRLFREEDGHLVVPAGLRDLVIDELQAAGNVVTETDCRSYRLSDPDLSQMHVLRDEHQIELVANIAAAEFGGVFEAPTGAGKSFIIKQICNMWREAKIIITCYSTEIVRDFYDKLSEIFPNQAVGMVGGGKNETGRRITCAVDKSLMKCDLENCDIFIYDEVHRSASRTPADAMAYLKKARRFGFSASPFGRGDKADIEIMAMFGPRLVEVSYAEVQETGAIVPIEVRMLSMRDAQRIQNVTPISIKRNGIWRNTDRNGMIVDAVTEAKAEFGKDVQILILVEKVEHVIEIAKHLPDFELVYGNMEPALRINAERKGYIQRGVHPITTKRRIQLHDSFQSGELRRAIATSLWSTGVDFPQLQVLINAGGQTNPIACTQIPGRVCRAYPGKTIGIMYDFLDEHDQGLERRARQRMAFYRKKGWEIKQIRPWTTPR
jgi:superfamily II DNA or RNA helicase